MIGPKFNYLAGCLQEMTSIRALLWGLHSSF